MQGTASAMAVWTTSCWLACGQAWLPGLWPALVLLQDGIGCITCYGCMQDGSGRIDREEFCMGLIGAMNKVLDPHVHTTHPRMSCLRCMGGP